MTANTQPLQMHPAPESVTRKGKSAGFAVANVDGNVDVRTPLSKRYAHVPGKHLPSLCRKLGVKFAPALVGIKGTRKDGDSPVIDGVVVSARVAERVREGIAERACAAAKKAEAKETREALRAQREAEAARREYEERWAELARQHGWVQRVPRAGSNRVGPDLLAEPPLELNTAEEWARLGYSVSGEPAGLHIRPGRPAPLYHRSRASVTPRAKSRQPAEQLWRTWRQQYPTDLLAATKALQAANKLVKIVPDWRVFSHEIYSIKDTFIRRWLSPHLVSGRVSRVETSQWWGGESRTLYEHHFLVDGHEVCFHSYERPAKLDETPGANLRQYGFRWTLAEIPDLRWHELLRLLRWVLQHVLTDATKVPPSAAR